MKILPTKKVLITLGISFGLLALVQLLVWYTSDQLQHTFASVSHSHQVRANLTRLLAAVQDVQMGQRGYLLTGDKNFLTPYTFGVQQTEAQFERLLQLTRSSSAQQERLNALKPLLDQKLAHAQGTITLRDTAGFEAAQREIASGKGQAMTDTIRLAIQEMEQEEAAVLVKRSQAARKATELNSPALVTNAAVSFTLLAVACFLLWRGNRRRAVAENESRTTTLMLHSVLHSVSDGVIATDAAGNFSVFTPAAEEILGVSSADACAAMSQMQWFQADERTPFAADRLPLARALRGEFVNKQDAFVRNTGRPAGLMLSVSARPLLGQDDAVMGAVMVFHKGSQRNVSEAPAAKVSEASVRKKQEPRKPNWRDELGESSDSKRAESFGTRVARPSSKPADEAATEIELFTKQQPVAPTVDKPSLVLRPQSLTTLIDQVVTMLAPAAELQQITLNQQLAAGLPELSLDRNRISEVLMNLLTNSLKYTPFGGNILVTAGQASPDEVHVSVVDNGCGIPPEQCEHIFERRDEVKTGSIVTQAGMGLHTCREFVQLHGGKIWVQSEPGKGSTFTFSLPMRSAATNAVTTNQKSEAQTPDASADEVEEFIGQLPWNKGKAA